MEQLNQKTIETTGIKQEEVEDAESLQSILNKFNDYVTNTFILKQKSFKIITFGSWELRIQLWVEAKQKSIDLAEYYLSYFDVIKEFRTKYSDEETPIQKIDHLLEAMRLKRRHDVIKSSKVSEILCTNILRVTHRLSKEGHIFQTSINHTSNDDSNHDDTSQHETKDQTEIKTETKFSAKPKAEIKNQDPLSPPSHLKEKVLIQGYEENKEEQNNNLPPEIDDYQPLQYIPEFTDGKYQNNGGPNSLYDSRRRERVSYMDNPHIGAVKRERTPKPPVSYNTYSDETIKYIKVKNLPPNCDKSKIIDFFNTIPIAYANIALVFDQTGRFNQESILALNSSHDQIEALAQSGRYIFNYQIEVQEAIPYEWESAQQSQKVFSRDDKVLVRMRGLPFSVRKEEILAFFQGYEIMPDSIIIGEMNNGKKTGEGVILFKKEEEASRAVRERNGSTLGKRWLELFLHPYSHFHSFFQAQNHEEHVPLNKFITDENKNRAVRLRGLPFSAQRKDIMSFFRNYNVTESDVKIEIKDSKPSGRALAILSDPITAVQAVQVLDKEYIGNRYIELDLVSNLPHEF